MELRSYLLSFLRSSKAKTSCEAHFTMTWLHWRKGVIKEGEIQYCQGEGTTFHYINTGQGTNRKVGIVRGYSRSRSEDESTTSCCCEKGKYHTGMYKQERCLQDT